MVSLDMVSLCLDLDPVRLHLDLVSLDVVSLCLDLVNLS